MVLNKLLCFLLSVFGCANMHAVVTQETSSKMFRIWIQELSLAKTKQEHLPVRARAVRKSFLCDGQKQRDIFKNSFPKTFSWEIFAQILDVKAGINLRRVGM